MTTSHGGLVEGRAFPWEQAWAGFLSLLSLSAECWGQRESRAVLGVVSRLGWILLLKSFCNLIFLKTFLELLICNVYCLFSP